MRIPSSSCPRSTGSPRWPSGGCWATHQGAIDDAHLADYLDEFVFRFNRRSSRCRAMLFYRVLQLAVDHDPVRYRDLIANLQAHQKPRKPPSAHGRPPSLERPPAGRPWRASDHPYSG